MEMMKDKENAKHFSLLINRINTEGDNCRQREEQGACLPSLCCLSLPHQAVMLCRLVDHSLAENMPAPLASVMRLPAFPSLLPGSVPDPQPFVPLGFSLHLSLARPAAGGVLTEGSRCWEEGVGTPSPRVTGSCTIFKREGVINR